MNPGTWLFQEIILQRINDNALQITWGIAQIIKKKKGNKIYSDLKNKQKQTKKQNERNILGSEK